MTELEGLLILNAISGLGNSRIRQLLDYYGSAARILSRKGFDLMNTRIVPQSIAEKISKFDGTTYVKKELELARRHKIQVLSFKDDDFPDNLKKIPDPPVLLYVKGQIQKENKLAVAIVGSRRCSLYGARLARSLAEGLSELGITIVSGLAYGIDTEAHRGALKAGGITVAVLGSGLLHVYPTENKGLFDKIVDSGGAVFSEFPLEKPPMAYHFPQRNRIVSGLSLGVVVVEASEKSGALITSRLALEQGREVFAVPGHVDSPNTKGVHHLIKQGAVLVGNVTDILQELDVPIQEYLKERSTEVGKYPRIFYPQKDLSEKERYVYGLIKNDMLHVDELSLRSKMPASQLMGLLLNLELKKCVKQFPGKLFCKAD